MEIQLFKTMVAWMQYYAVVLACCSKVSGIFTFFLSVPTEG